MRRLLLAAAALSGLVACGAPCSAYCQKLLSCAPTSQLACEDEPTCEERCSEANAEDRTGDFAAGTACVANPNYSCTDLLNGACPAPQAPATLPAVQSCTAVGGGRNGFVFPTYASAPWQMCSLQPGTIGGIGCSVTGG